MRISTQLRRNHQALGGVLPAGGCARDGRRDSGFTLLEIMVVLAIVIILATLASASYQRSVVHAKEAALRQDLSEMRKAIDNYTMDKEAAPNSLDDLITAKYLYEIPVDPMTGQSEWSTDDCDDLLSPDQTSTGICNVHSESDAVSPFDNTAYSSW
ncbi:MAG TPA: type II secretion system protein [Candidatus Aquilonibacter sp.]|nr:type II secretion system protein [Candidatus Aquilonibacter sp.]